MEANIVLMALNLILFVIQIAAFANTCSKLNILNINDKKALEQYYKYRDAEREEREVLKDYQARIKMLDKAEEIAAIIAEKKE